MKGIVFNLLEEVVSRNHSEDTWDDILEAAELEGAYTSLGNYPDEDLGKLVGAASSALEKPTEEIVRWFGTKVLPLLAERYPNFFEEHKCARSFLLSLNGIHHTEVCKIYPNADVPDFTFHPSSDDVLVMEYNSHRQMCAFAEGLIRGAAAYFGEQVAIEQPRCLLRGERSVHIPYYLPQR